jgi:uncharacterized protein
MSQTLASFMIALCIIAGSAPAQSQELSKQAKIERILELTRSDASANQAANQISTMIASQMKSQMPKASPEQLARVQEVMDKLMDLVKAKMAWARLRPDFIKAYSDLYTDEEIDGMLAFYESPAGRGFIDKLPQLTQKTIAISQAQMGDLMPEIQRIVAESLQKKQ